MIKGRGITFSYDGPEVLKDIEIEVTPGEMVAILGRNGSGKTTLARHMNALLKLQQGSLCVAGIDVTDDKQLWKLRRTAGMVFQNPDNQFVSSIVEEDIAFGLENYEVPREEIPGKVREALEMVGMTGYEKRSPHMLSGGQKQRVALAGVLALSPEILIFDESTAMLDPEGRREVLKMMDDLRQEGKTILVITHYVEESLTADRLIIMDRGRILGEGRPREILQRRGLLEMAGLVPPFAVRMYWRLADLGIRLDQCPLTSEELAEALEGRMRERGCL